MYDYASFEVKNFSHGLSESLVVVMEIVTPFLDIHQCICVLPNMKIADMLNDDFKHEIDKASN